MVARSKLRAGALLIAFEVRNRGGMQPNAQFREHDADSDTAHYVEHDEMTENSEALPVMQHI